MRLRISCDWRDLWVGLAAYRWWLPTVVETADGIRQACGTEVRLGLLPGLALCLAWEGWAVPPRRGLIGLRVGQVRVEQAPSLRQALGRFLGRRA